ncbi:MAG TPA: STT3 domain-containing protein [Candidatus Nanoarchaeia archaeon]|nr:STT3 domain-containing protein [Candidatus Nanoarchaeia archaeon]
MDDVLNKRKEKLISFIKNYKVYLVFFILAIIIWYGFNIRTQNIGTLKDSTTGKYITAELDSTLFLRYAQYIAEHGTLFKVDQMRFYPIGADLTGIGVFTSYFVAYLWKFLHVFNPSLTVEYVDIIYPLIAMITLSIFMFLLMRKLFDWKTGLLSVLFINILPTFIFRSTAGSTDHDILAVMLMIMAFYFYFISTKTDNLLKSIILAAFAGIITVAAMETAGNANFILFIFGAFNIVKILFDKFKKQDYYTYLAWILPFIIYWQFLTDYGIRPFLSAAPSLTAFAALALATIYMILFEFKVVKLSEKISNSLPKGIIALIVTVLISTVILYFILGSKFFIDMFFEVYHHLFEAYGQSRWSLTVAENRKPFVVDWMSEMGKLYVYFFIFGSIALFYNTVKKLKASWKLTIIYALFIFGYVFSRYSPNTKLNGETGIAHFLFYGSILLFFGTLSYGYLRTFYKNRELFKDIENNLNIDYSFVFIWFFIKIIAATSAIRLMFEFSLVTAPLAAFFVVFAFDYFKALNNKILRYALIFLLVFLLISPFSFSKGIVLVQADSSYQQAKSIYPWYNQQWQQAGKWARENTPKDAVFAHWWDYGYWVQSGFERATVTDGGNFFIYWNYLSGRHLLTAQDSNEALEFMKAHNATYLLMVADEIGKYGAYSSIGSDENYDRFSTIGTFSLDPKQTQATKNETLLIYQGGVTLDETYKYKGTVFPGRASGVIGFIVHVGNMTADTRIFTGKFNRVDAVIAFQDKQHLVPLQCVFFNNVEYRFDGEDFMSGCLRIIPTFTTTTKGDFFGAAIFVSPRVYRTLFGQMYLLGKDLPGFKTVYEDSSNMPLAIYQGRLIGPLKIWEADTRYTKFKPEYLETQYPDIRLTLPN